MSRFRISRLSGATAAITAFLVFHSAAEAQQAPRRVAVGLDLAAPIAPLNKITVPDVNVLGILDNTAPTPNGPDWASKFGGQITNNGKQKTLQQLGKALFWDMQVGGDGIQSCASCHYHAGADNRTKNQLSPGLNRVHGGEDPVTGVNRWPDTASDSIDSQGQDLAAPNYLLTADDYANLNANNPPVPVGLPVSELALVDWTPDDVNGVPGEIGTKADPLDDVNDVVSSQGVRLGDFVDITLIEVCVDNNEAAIPCTVETVRNPDIEYSFFTAGRDAATLAKVDPGFNLKAGDFDTVRRVEPRNSPTAVNAVYHMRNFWDGRADMFFNGVTPLGFREPDAAVRVYDSASQDPDGPVLPQWLRIPFSSLASQAVGPTESNKEMIFSGRLNRDLGKKLLQPGVQPLAGQKIATDDSLLGELADNMRNHRGLKKSYRDFITEIFHERFWGGFLEQEEGSPPRAYDVCVGENGSFVTVADGQGENPSDCSASAYTLMEYNFALFFGLAVQAYEATLFTEQTIVDLLVGGIATGSVTNQTLDRRGRVQSTVTVPVTGLPLQGCIAAAALANNAAQQAAATELCIRHYAQWIHPKATAGSQAAIATGIDTITEITKIGGCVIGTPGNTATTLLSNGNRTFSNPCGTGGELAGTVSNILASVQAIDRGMGRFFAGATGCAICHFNPEFTGATVAALTGFGAAPPPPLPPGQLRRIPLEVPMERMIAFNGAPAVYDAGFYNLGVRPTPEDLALGDHIGGVPLAFSKLAEQIQIFLGAGSNPEAVQVPYDGDKIEVAAAELGIDPTDGIPVGTLFIPNPLGGRTDLTPMPWTLQLACGPGLVGNGNGNANNNPTQGCVPNVIPGERLLRNGAFKAQGLRNVKFTGPYLHNGSKMNLSQVVNFYETAGHFPNLNLNNLDAGMRIFDLGVQDTAALVEFMETGLTDWRLAYEEGKFAHPEICVPHGHDETTEAGKTILVGIPAVGAGGNADPLATFEDIVRDTSSHAHDLKDPCMVPGVVAAGATGPANSLIDVPPAL